MSTTTKSSHAKSPGKFRRLLLISTALLLVSATALVVYIIYLSRHPAAVKPLIEKALSLQTGWIVRIEHLDFSLNPIRVDARGISVGPDSSSAGVEFEFRTLSVQAAITGPFGQKTLTIETLRLDHYTGRLESTVQLPMPSTGEQPSFFSRAFKRLFRYVFISDVTLQRVEALDGKLSASTPSGQATMSISRILSGYDGAVHIQAAAWLDTAAGSRIIELPVIEAEIAAPGFASSRPVSGNIALHAGAIDSVKIVAADLTGSADIRYEPAARRIGFTKVDVRGRVNPLPDSRQIRFEDVIVALTASAAYQLENRQLNITHWSLACENLVKVNGTALLQASAPYPFRLTAAEGGLDPADLMRRLPYPAENRKWPLSLSGPLRIQGEVSGRLADTPEKWQGMLKTGFEQNAFTAQSGAYQLSGLVTGVFDLTGPLLDPQLRAELRVTDTRLAGAPFDLSPFEAFADIEGQYPAYRTNLRIRAPRIQLRTGNGDLGLYEMTVVAQNGRLDMRSSHFVLPAVSISTNTLNNLTMRVDASNQGLQLELTGQNTALADAAADWGLIPTGWQVDGSDRIKATVIVDELQQVLVTATLSLADLSGASPDERFMLDGLQATADINLRFQPTQRKWSSVAKFTVDAGEVLLDRYYHDFSANGLHLSGQGGMVLPSRQIALDGIRLKLEELVELQAFGRVSPSASPTVTEATVLLPETELNPLFHQFIREPFKFENPSLDNLSIDGRISGQLQFANLAERWSFTGRLAWVDGHLSVKDKPIALSGIELDFPVWQGAPDPAAAEPSLPGSLSIAALRLPMIDRQPLQLSLKAGPNSLHTTAPVDFAMANGMLQLGSVQVKSLYSTRPQLSTSLSVQGVDLDSLMEKAGTICSGGLVNGELPDVRLTGSALSSRGTLTADLCGGRVRIHRPGIGALISASPAIRFDATIESVDLEQLTQGTAFGRIQGVLNGTVDGLEIVNGQPQAFNLLLQTERTKGVPQKINVRAVENIASIGGGGNPFMGLAGSFVTLFKEFSYSQIGVRAILQNDVFRINGTIREGDREYLVKKGGLSGVDVVNLNPDNRISFKDMVKRIQRIRQSKSGPVVK